MAAFKGAVRKIGFGFNNPGSLTFATQVQKAARAHVTQLLA